MPEDLWLVANLDPLQLILSGLHRAVLQAADDTINTHYIDCSICPISLESDSLTYTEGIALRLSMR